MPVWLKKLEVGGGVGIGEYSWTPDSPVCEVPDPLGQELLQLGGFEQAEEPKPAAKPAAKAAPADEAAKPAASTAK